MSFIFCERCDSPMYPESAKKCESCGRSLCAECFENDDGDSEVCQECAAEDRADFRLREQCGD